MRTLIPQADLERRIAEMAAEINRDYAESDSLICVGVLKGSVFFTRPHLADYMQPTEVGKRAADLFGLAASGRLEVTIDRTFALAQLPDAHRLLESRQSRGKLLVAL